MTSLQDNCLEWVNDQRLRPFCTSVSFSIENDFSNDVPIPRVIMILEFDSTEFLLKQYLSMVSIEDSSGNLLATADNDGDRVRIADRLFSYLNNSGSRNRMDFDSLDMIERIIYKLMVGEICLLRGD